MRDNVWKMHEARARFSELVERAVSAGPQVVTLRGVETVVVISIEEYRQATGPRSPRDFFRREPFFDELELDRDKSVSREIEL